MESKKENINYEGNILKMRTKLTNPVHYLLPVGDQEIDMNRLIGHEIKLCFTGQINCISCGKITKTSFKQGFCYNCLQTAPEAGESVVRPELSKAHFGIARDMEWAEKHDLLEHIVYLAVTSELKVGVTLYHQIPVRWIDQGASCAIQLARTPNRHIAGIIEVFMKKKYTDRTNWQVMLKNGCNSHFDLLREKKKTLELLPPELKKYYYNDDAITAIDYPLLSLPEKVKNTGFDKSPGIVGILKGIKGQYLVFEDNTVLNIRKHSGYYLQISV